MRKTFYFLPFFTNLVKKTAIKYPLGGEIVIGYYKKEAFLSGVFLFKDFRNWNAEDRQVWFFEAIYPGSECSKTLSGKQGAGFGTCHIKRPLLTCIGGKYGWKRRRIGMYFLILTFPTDRNWKIFEVLEKSNHTFRLKKLNIKKIKTLIAWRWQNICNADFQGKWKSYSAEILKAGNRIGGGRIIS